MRQRCSVGRIFPTGHPLLVSELLYIKLNF